MKKVLFALAAICACASLQALTLTWNATNIETVTNVTRLSLIYSSIDADGAVANAISAIGTYGTTTSGNYTEVALGSWSEPNGVVGQTGTFEGVADDKKYATGSYFIIFTGANNTYYWDVVAATSVPWVTTSGTAPQGLSVTFDSYVVPEPTVMALLALGVAGLALKRKHA